MVNVYTRFNDDGNAIFHFVYKPFTDELGNEKMHLLSNLPTELLRETSTEIVNLFDKESRHLKKHTRELFSMLGEKIEYGGNAEPFYYPTTLLRNNTLSDVSLRNVIELQNKRFVFPDAVYSINHFALRFYILKCKFLRYQKYYPNRFQSEVMEVSRDEFEAQLNFADAMIQYAPFVGSCGNKFFQNVTIDGYACYSLFQNSVPQLFVIKA